ncbi:MAG: AraC family transcriptional regulator [Granulosicoccus sp.]|nr:AraC family transcriptional regulator [Granulosicoccus sp.]
MSPDLKLASCVRAYIVRNTIGMDLGPDDRLSYFPAVPTVGITFFLEGRIDWIRSVDGTDFNEYVDTVLFSGPHTKPTVAYNPGEVNAIICMFMPDAFYQLTGISAADWVNKVAPLNDVLEDDWRQLAEAVSSANSEEVAITLLNSFISDKWSIVRKQKVPYMRRYEDWLNALALQAHQTGIGKSVRQIERRIKHLTGLPMRELRNIARAEQLFFKARKARENGNPNWPSVALDAGYSDQAHMSRATRKASGFSPTELRRKIEETEAFWVYRIWQ